MSSTHDAPTRIVNDILANLDISLEHPAACHKEAQAWVEEPGFSDPALTDWTSIPFVTIDNADSRDLDQALYIERTDTGYRLRYALADAAYYVRPGSALFSEALRRGTTFYTPLIAAPMLPRSLSEGLLSLNPGVDRRALVFDMHLDNTAENVKTNITRALVHSQAKLSYEGVQRSLDSQAHEKTAASRENYSDSLLLLAELGELLIERGLERGVIPFSRRESQVNVSNDNPDNKPRFKLEVRERLGTERYNEQLSLLCNMEGAALLQSGLLDKAQPQSEHSANGRSHSQPVFRIHDAPLAARRRQLEKTLDELANVRGLDEQWRLKPEQSLADYVTRLKSDQTSHSLVQAVQRHILLSQRASSFTAEPGLHYALAAPHYARFSSPMREIVGIFTHKELFELLEIEPSQQSAEQDNELREVVIAAANQAKQTQRKIEKAVEFNVIEHLLRDDLQLDKPPVRKGTLLGIRDKRLYVQIDELALDLKVYLQDLETQHGCQYRLSDVQAIPDQPQAPQFTVGDVVSLSTFQWDAERRRFVLHLQPG